MEEAKYFTDSERNLLSRFAELRHGKTFIRTLFDWLLAEEEQKDAVWDRLASLYDEFEEHNRLQQSLDLTSVITGKAEGMGVEGIGRLQKEAEQLIGGGKHRDRGRQAV